METRLRAILVCLLAVSACAPRPVVFGFWMEAVTYQSPRIGEPLTAAEFATIAHDARSEIARAFADYDVTITDDRDARYKVAVLPTLKDERLTRGGTYAGESRAIAGFGGSGAVNFEYVANGAMVVAPESATRAEVIAAIGRGVGRVAIHELVHQLLPKSPLHDSKDPESYEGNSPAVREGYFGELHWGIARPWLSERLNRRRAG
jgi:hypothetical protein